MNYVERHPHCNGKTPKVGVLLELGIWQGVTVANREGWTPLNSAAHNGHVDVVKLLLERWADVTVATQVEAFDEPYAPLPRLNPILDLFQP